MLIKVVMLLILSCGTNNSNNQTNKIDNKNKKEKTIPNFLVYRGEQNGEFKPLKDKVYDRINS